jgi:glutathione synthase/RimK-type ligase-like ATP-grasp enzyme
LAEALDDGVFPIIARPIDTHAGQGLVKIDAPNGIAAFLEGAPDTEFHVSRFIDYSGADGQFRKYRIVLIDGRPYACHMGISRDWMIHYLNAGMAESAEKRAEEARFMSGFDEDFAPRHTTAFAAIQARMQLDYLIIDCAETRDGELLIFEVDTGAVVHAMDPVDLFPYKQPQMHKVFAAFRAMLGAARDRDRDRGYGHCSMAAPEHAEQ